jgi:pimeloyl-ACP methyl ester carboxylesterase
MTAPTGTTYLVDGQRITLVCKGRGRIPVVFQAGGNDTGDRWDGLVAALGPDVLTCVFDRPGVAPSAPSPTLLTPRSVSKTLAGTLAQAHIGPRVILVGHSIGGLNSLVFGAEYPDQVAGAVLFDPSEADFFESTHSDATLVSVGYEPNAVYSQIRAVTRWPTVPLVVLSRDPAKAVADQQDTASQEQIWIAGATRYAKLSPRGVRTAVPGTTHYVYLDAPQVAADAIRQILHDAA